MIDILYLFAAFFVKLFRKKSKGDGDYSTCCSPAPDGIITEKDPSSAQVFRKLRSHAKQQPDQHISRNDRRKGEGDTDFEEVAV